MYLGTVHDGAITYRLATMEKHPATQGNVDMQGPSDAPRTPYARVGEDGVSFAGPRSADLTPGPVRVVLSDRMPRRLRSRQRSLQHCAANCRLAGTGW